MGIDEPYCCYYGVLAGDKPIRLLSEDILQILKANAGKNILMRDKEPTNHTHRINLGIKHKRNFLIK